jgi:hypothetical protein
VITKHKTCIDIVHVTGVPTHFSVNPGKPHYEALKCIPCYLNGTAHFGLMLGESDSKTNLVGWSDADWAQDVEMRCLIGMFVFDVAGGYILWSSKKQPTIALSTAEAEYMSASNATKEAIWLCTLLTDMGFPPTKATTIHMDNQACITLTYNPVNHSCTKHIDI